MIRWNIRDRATGQCTIVLAPTNHQGRENLRAAIRNLTTIGQRRAFA